jgi:RNA polymerase sigma-70 factor (ECF subfamily)
LDEEQVLRIYRETIRPLYAYVSRRVGGDSALAEDVVQDTWMAALRHWPGSGLPGEPLAWLVRVAHNNLASHFRRLRPEPIDVEAAAIEDGSFKPGTPDTAAVIGWGMARLRNSDAEVLEAFYFDGKSLAEIAVEQVLSERAVEGRLHRARIKLRAKIERLVRPVKAAGMVKGGI